MTGSHDTPETREEARARGYRDREVLPSKRAQERYPLSEFPCERCEKEGLPHLVDNGCEFYWHHQEEPPGNTSRSGCPRFGGQFCGSRPKPGTATSLFKKSLKGYPVRTEEEYLEAQRKVEEFGADDAWYRVTYMTGPPP